MHWSIQQPENSWLIINSSAGVTGPYSSQSVSFTIDGSALASDSNYDVEIIINSNDSNNPSLPVNLDIQVNPPDLYMVGLNNNSYTIQEDDSVETTFYIVGHKEIQLSVFQEIQVLYPGMWLLTMSTFPTQ